MWFFKGFLFLLLLFVLAYFFITNSGQAVDLNFFGHSYLGISIYWGVVVSYLVGFLTSFVMAAFREFQLRRRMRGLQKNLKLKEKEIAELRTIPLKEDPEDEVRTGREDEGNA